ncbi:exopolygalacturonase-like [Wolffia australiana]
MSKGRPKVLVPRGTFLVGTLDFSGPCNGTMVFEIEGVVVAPTDLSVFSSSRWISFSHLNGFLLTGGSFDGRGNTAWPFNQCPKKFDCKLLPTSLSFNFIANAVIRGITSVDSKFFHVIVFASNNIVFSSIKLIAPENSPNTDGIHIGSSSNIKIFDSTVTTGDDCISLGEGVTNITIARVSCGPGHGISVGSLGKYANQKDVVGVTVTNCTFTGTMNGVRIKTWMNSFPLNARSFVFEDLVMNNVYNPIIIDQEYCPYVSCDNTAPSRVKISDVKFRNIRGVSASKIAVKLQCSAAAPCEGVDLALVDLRYSGEEAAASSTCSNVMGTTSGSVNPASCI